VVFGKMAVFRNWRKLIPPVLWTMLDVPGLCKSGRSKSGLCKSGTASDSKTERGLSGRLRSMEIRTWAAVAGLENEKFRIEHEVRFCGTPDERGRNSPVTMLLLAGAVRAGAGDAGSMDARQLLRKAPAAAEE